MMGLRWIVVAGFLVLFEAGVLGQSPAAQGGYTERELANVAPCVGETMAAWDMAEWKAHGRSIADAKKAYDTVPESAAKAKALSIVDQVYGATFKSSWEYGVAYFQECAQRLANLPQQRSSHATLCMQRGMIGMTAAAYKKAGRPISLAYGQFAGFKGDAPRNIIERAYVASKTWQAIGSDEWKACISPLVIPENGQPSWQARTLAPLTAEKIESLLSTTNNPAGDFYLGTPKEQELIVKAFVADNSKSDPIHLYLAAKTALKLGDNIDAGFLFYAAQIRFHLDSKRFKPSKTDGGGSDWDTYVGFLNQTIGESVNPSVAADSSVFNTVVEMIQRWDAAPAGDALYPSSMYGTPSAPAEKWAGMGETEKKDFMDNFVAVMRKKLGIK
jgi:hypothetical protein